MNKKLIRLTESDLHKIVEESVNRIINESGFYPMEYDSKMGYYTPNGTVDGVDTYIGFDDMSFSELKALRDKYLEQVGHTPWNKIANARPDIFHAVNAIEEELEDRRERYREGDKSALS